MKARVYEIICLTVFFCVLYGLSTLYHNSNLFYTEDEKLQNYMSSIYKEWFVVNSVGVVDIFGAGSNGVSYYKGYFVGEPEVPVVVNVMGNNSFSKYYLSNKDIAGERCELLENIVNRYFDYSISDVKLMRGVNYINFEPGMGFNNGVDYLLNMGETLNFEGIVQVSASEMTKQEFEKVCKILYSDLDSEDYYFNLIIEGSLGSKEYARAIMTRQKYLPKKDNRVSFEYVY